MALVHELFDTPSYIGMLLWIMVKRLSSVFMKNFALFLSFYLSMNLLCIDACGGKEL